MEDNNTRSIGSARKRDRAVWEALRKGLKVGLVKYGWRMRCGCVLHASHRDHFLAAVTIAGERTDSMFEVIEARRIEQLVEA